MNIEKVLKTVELTIKNFKAVFPELVEYADVNRYEKETIAAILAYEKKATLISEDLLKNELQKFLKTGKEIFDEGFHNESYRDRADNVLLGMLEMNWIGSFLNEMEKSQKELLNTKKSGQNTASISHNQTTQSLDINQNNMFLEYNTVALLEMLIKNDEMFESDYLQFIEKYNINTAEKLKTFYSDYLNFASRRINLKIIESFKNAEFKDYIINVLLKSAIKKFKSKDNSVFLKPKIEFLDDIFILNHENIFIKAEEIFFNCVVNLANNNNIFSDWDSNEENDFWEKFSINNYFGWLNITEINSSIRTISFLSKEITPPLKDISTPQKFDGEPQVKTSKNEIEMAFSFMQHNDPRKHKRIVSDDDFDSLMKWITYYFENNFTIPEIDKPIKVINTNKGNIVYTFIKIFKDLHPTKTRPDSLFDLIKLCFYDYRNDNISNYKKQKEPQFYSQLIKK